MIAAEMTPKPLPRCRCRCGLPTPREVLDRNGGVCDFCYLGNDPFACPGASPGEFVPLPASRAIG
jgi:hypothetical protein